jgi:hypothetical protein
MTAKATEVRKPLAAFWETERRLAPQAGPGVSLACPFPAVRRSLPRILAVLTASSVFVCLADPLPRDPYDAWLLENDVVGARLFGPATQPTLSLGRSDIWDRRWFAEQQPLITMVRLRELAMTDKLKEIARTPNSTVYSLYGRYDFPCPKPGAQVILGTPFGTSAEARREEDQRVRLVVKGPGHSLTARVWVPLLRPLVIVEVEADGLSPADFWVRVHRHWDTILPGEPVDPTLGGERSGTDFERFPAPRAQQGELIWGIRQDFPAELTFPNGFRVVAVATALGAKPAIELKEDAKDLGTPLWAEKEGRLDHGVVKRYQPINEAPGAAATATFDQLPKSFAIVVAIVTTQDDPDPQALAAKMLKEARASGLEGLRREQTEALRRARRQEIARATVAGAVTLRAPAFVFPNLRKPDGYYGDVALCSVGSTKFCFQDAGLWHNDFHLNEIRAEGMLTLGQFEEVLGYCRLIRTLLPQAQENAREVYALPGAMYPLVHFPLRARGIAHVNLTWEQDMGINGLVSKPLWLYYRYTGDRNFLRAVAYPVLREGARFMRAYLREEADGRLHIVPTVSPEHWGLTTNFERNRDCTSALTLTRYLLRAAAEGARTLGTDRQEAATWQAASERLAPYPTAATTNGPVWVDVAGAPPIEYNVPVPLSPVFWGDDVGPDSPAETWALARRTLEQIRIWQPHRGYLDSTIRPRLGLPGAVANLGVEHLLQSYQAIRLFPAAPSDQELVIENFAAEGGFRVSAKCRNGQISDVCIRSIVGRPCRVVHPWPGRSVAVIDRGGGEIASAAGSSRFIEFPTRAGATYRLDSQ